MSSGADADGQRPAVAPEPRPPGRAAAAARRRRAPPAARPRPRRRAGSSAASRRSSRRRCRAGCCRSRCGVPTCTSRPSLSTPILSPIDIASIWSWVTKRKVAPSVHLQVLELGAQRLAQLGVEVRQRLVHQEDARLAHDGAADRDALHLAARQPVGLAVEQVLDAQRLRRRAPTRSLDLVVGHAAQLRLQREVEVLRAPCSAGRASIAEAPAPRRARPRSSRRRPRRR